MDPITIANLALLALNAVLNIIKNLKASGGLTGDQLAALAEQQDLANLDTIKKLLGE